MYRALLTLIALFTVPVAFTQSIEVASCSDCKAQPLEKRSAPRMLIRAKCAFPDGAVVAEQLVEIDASASAQEKRAAAEQVCRPIMDAAANKCDDLANKVDALKSQKRLAQLHSFREHELASEIKAARASAPPYCK
jgi:hypothetical protein